MIDVKDRVSSAWIVAREGEGKLVLDCHSDGMGSVARVVFEWGESIRVNWSSRSESGGREFQVLDVAGEFVLELCEEFEESGSFEGVLE